MRPYLLLIFTSVILAFFSGKYILKFQGPGSASNSDIAEISKTKFEFQKRVTPFAIVNFSSLYYNDDQLELLNPSLFLDRFDNKLLSSTKNCSQFNLFTALTNVSKESIWEYYRCGNLTSLPFWFFKRAPFMHNSGNSYAYLFYKLSTLSGKKVNWDELKNLMNFFHLRELSSIQREVGPLGGIHGILAGLDEDTVFGLIHREGTILTKEYLLAKINYPDEMNILEYRFYLREDLNNFLESSPYQVSRAASGKPCLYVDGPICWRYNVKHLFQMINSSTVITFIGIVVILVLILWLLVSKIKSDRFDEERRKMALQVLTHEFRTPVATLLLVVDKFNRNIANYDENTQEDILRFASEVYRLQRLTEKSKHYLQGLTGNRLIKLNLEEVNDIEEVILDIIAPVEMNYDKKVKTVFENLPPILYLDLYWFQIIVKNIIENSLMHGEGEVNVDVRAIKDNLIIKVSDEGRIDKKLAEMTKEFAKGNKSQGSGLGLNIVEKIIKEWSGSLKFKNDPSTFIISLPMKLNQGAKNGKDIIS